jgi:hypothetical protein
MYLKKNYDLQITPGKNADLRSDFNLPEKKEGESDTNYISDCFKFIDKKLDYAKKEVSY